MSQSEPQHFGGAEKVKILRLHFLEGKAVSELCEQHKISSSQFYQWQQTFFENGSRAFEGSSNSRSDNKLEKQVDDVEAYAGVEPHWKQDATKRESPKFIDAANAEVQGLPQGDRKRVVLEYLLLHCRGAHNARPWLQLKAHLAGHGIDMKKRQYQQTILADSRSGNIFIGSSDREGSKGYFIIQDRADADVAREFYTRRIAAQQTNLDRLDTLIDQHQFPSP